MDANDPSRRIDVKCSIDVYRQITDAARAEGLSRGAFLRSAGMARAAVVLSRKPVQRMAALDITLEPSEV